MFFRKNNKSQQKPFVKKNKGNRRNEFENPRSINQNAPNPSQWAKPFISKWPGIGVPDKLRLRVKFTETVAFGAAVSPAAQVWQPNSIFQIDSSAGSGVPSLYNFLKTAYTRYIVMGFEGVLEVTNDQAISNSSTFAMGCSDNNTGAKTVVQIAEQRYSISKDIPGASGSPNKVTVKWPYLSMAQVQGQPEIESDPNMYSGMAANPVDAVWLVFRITSQTAVNASGNLRLTIVQDIIVKDASDVIT